MWDFIHNPYPFNDDFRRNLKIILGLCTGIFLFLILFDPFKIPVQDFNNKIQIILGYTLITIGILVIILILLPFLFPGVFLAGKWTIKKEIILNACFFIVHSTGYLVFSELTGLYDMSTYLIIRILLISTTLIVILFAFNQDRVLRMHLQTAMAMIRNIGGQASEVPKDANFTIPSETKSDQITLPINSLIFIRSADNYVEIAWLEKQNIKKKLVRATLKETETALKVFPNIVKCHRTCLVNINNMIQLKETPGGLTLLVDEFKDEIPVSRQYLKEIKSILKRQ
jgi:hypothetical protein